MKTEYTFTGVISNSGKLLISNKAELEDFCKRNHGKAVTGLVKCFQPQSSHAIRGYYYNKIVPDFQEAFKETGERLGLEETEKKLREMSPIMWQETVNEDTGKYVKELRMIHECSNAEMSEYIEHLKQIAAENFSFYI
jgi:hypothetical protein